MQVKKLQGSLSDPAAREWGSAVAETVGLAPPPLDAQPTEYIRVKWADKAYGVVPEAEVAAAHDGSNLYVRIEWADSETPNTEFQDAAGVYFPAAGDAPVGTMGSADAPVRLAYWQANLAEAKDLVATGPGAFKPGGNGVSAAASNGDGRWAVVLSRGLAEGTPEKIGVAVWDGSNEERGGLGAVSQDWIALEIEN